MVLIVKEGSLALGEKEKEKSKENDKAEQSIEKSRAEQSREETKGEEIKGSRTKPKTDCSPFLQKPSATASALNSSVRCPAPALGKLR